MPKRVCKQVLRSDKAEKLKLWDENPDWTPTEAAKKLGVSRTTLLGWRGDPKLSADKAPAENGDGFRAKGAGRKHRLEEYECDAIAFYDQRLAEGEPVTHSVMREHCKTKYSAFALKDVLKQHN
ncbi:Cysteine protease [Phytophthora megakarya]|uniref:Cysteine protease n=1 Tax=Phytophthora megakarya TaxID=4795 RepID=A0A225UN24_9STRA|nr:Cysteine protease [Phytophthora megakarya]